MTDRPGRPERAAILGAGADGVTFGAGLAALGMPVVVIEPDPGAAERAQFFLAREGCTLDFTDDPRALADADIVFDAAGEDPSEMRFAQNALRDHLAPGAILLSGRAVPLHPAATGFHVPGGSRRLVEVNDPALCPLLRDVGRVPVAVPRGPVARRLLDRLGEEADRMLLTGAVLWELDEAMVQFGFDLGPFEAQDLAGLDDAYARRKASGRRLPIADRAVEEGRIGKKIGWGWYRYPGGGGAVIDPLIEDLIREEARFAKVPQRDFTPEDIRWRLLLALIAEAGAILDDRAVFAARDLDVISVAGLGFPAALGGIVSHADTLGLGRVLADLERLCADDALRWKPPASLQRCTATGTALADYRPA